MFEVGFADDAGLAVRRSQGMGRMKLVEAEDADSAFREMINGGAAHRAQARDDDIERLQE